MKLTHIARAGLLTVALVVAGYVKMMTANEPEKVEVAQSAGSFDMLVAAVSATGLAIKLKADGPFTVFAPADAAFTTLPNGTMDSLLLPENKDQLIAILTYRVLPGRIMSSDVSGNRFTATRANGASLDVVGARIANI